MFYQEKKYDDQTFVLAPLKINKWRHSIFSGYIFLKIYIGNTKNGQKSTRKIVVKLKLKRKKKYLSSRRDVNFEASVGTTPLPLNESVFTQKILCQQIPLLYCVQGTSVSATSTDIFKTATNAVFSSPLAGHPIPIFVNMVYICRGTILLESQNVVFSFHDEIVQAYTSKHCSFDTIRKLAHRCAQYSPSVGLKICQNFHSLCITSKRATLKEEGPPGNFRHLADLAKKIPSY